MSISLRFFLSEHFKDSMQKLIGLAEEHLCGCVKAQKHEGEEGEEVEVVVVDEERVQEERKRWRKKKR